MLRKFIHKLYKQHLSPREEVLLVFQGSFSKFAKGEKKTFFLGIILPVALAVIFYPKLFIYLVVWAVIGLLRFSYLWYTWVRDTWILTNLGLVKVTWNGPYRLTTSRIEFPDIAEVGVDKQGIVQHFSGFGNIQIALNNGNVIEFPNQSNPNIKVKMLLEVRSEFMRQAQWGNEDTLKDLLAAIVAKHMGDFGAPFKDQKTKEYEEDVVIEVIQKERWDK